MNIALIGQHDNYGTMGSWCADGFEMNGHKIDRIDRKDIVLNPEQYDFLFYVDCSEDFSDRIPKCDKCLKVAWLLDSHMPQGKERSVNIARKCDLVFSSNYEYGVKILEKFGVESYLMPITYNDRLVNKQSDTLTEGYDIAMIGHANSPERVKLWKMLNDNYNCFTGEATEDEYIRVMSNCKIVVNQPTEPWDIILNNRFFEGMGFGKVVLQKRLNTELIEKLGFEDKRDFIYWNKLENLKGEIDLALEDGCEDIAESGNKKVKQYSMSAQCAKIESIILSKFYNRL